MKKVIFLIIFLFSISKAVFAKEIAVKIKPAYKITTSNLNLKEGDSVDFVTSQDVFINSKFHLKKGQEVTGIVTGLEENDYFVEPAKLYIENFRTLDSKNEPVKLNGIIYRVGNDHHELTEFFVFDLLRGGEVQIKPEKDEFTIYAEENL